ncbi:MAG TPA: Holliday junction branch migration protein RuvA [Nitrospirae bacterium]|nr:Holliday junction ATP-dependent DNA helicase RuvA [bacterium BMS3Abin06]HDH12123.1 Holliday junction branch migration protein RuvA [Nitrospirota bacterium]HDZ02371.1 Holliday junction branch migration protein RuvA [Nitrospirota bacterium]
MIASLNGTVLSKKPEGVVIDVGGIGYHVSIPLCSLSDIPEPGENVFLNIYTHVREDALQLFGFLSDEERKVFTTLIGISGIGPRLALAILSGMPVNRFIETVNNEDVSLLTTIPGLGKKTAGRLILELKGKLPSMGAGDALSPKENSNAGDAISALINLGYKKPFSEEAVDRAMKNGADAIEDIIKEALKSLTGSK